MASKFGLSAALTTPFDASGALDLARMTAHAASCLSAGCDSVTLFGTTGEGSSVGTAERGLVLAAMLKAGIRADQIVAGVLVDSAEDAAAQSAEALDAGAKAVLLAPPSYFKNPSDEGLFAWFARTIALIGPKARDIIIYNIPSVTAVKLSVPLVGRLKAAFPGVVTGVKDSGGDWDHTEALLSRYGDMVILVGDERHLARATRMGGQGAISGLANVLPDQIRAMAVDGTEVPEVVALVGILLQYPVTPAVKALVALVSGDAAWLTVRPPLVQTSEEARRAVCAAFTGSFPGRAG